jgi:hypothetical protein
MWAKPRSRDGVASADYLDADNRYDWKTSLEVAAILNGWGAASPTPLIPISGSGGYSDWRVPNFVELTTIKSPTQPGCSAAETVACIDPVFGPTVPGGYWTTTTHDPDFTWWVHFGDPTLIGLSIREVFLGVRPVRTAF